MDLRLTQPSSQHFGHFFEALVGSQHKIRVGKVDTLFNTDNVRPIELAGCSVDLGCDGEAFIEFDFDELTAATMKLCWRIRVALRQTYSCSCWSIPKSDLALFCGSVVRVELLGAH